MFETVLNMIFAPNMNRFLSKYKNFSTIIIFSGYLFLFGFNTFHYHQINLLENSSYQIDNPHIPANNGHSGLFEFQCPVHSSYTSIHNLFLQSSWSNYISISNLDIIRFSPQNFNYQKVICTSNSLRAPPSVLFS